MPTNDQKIQCPKCGVVISIDDVLTHQIEEKVKKDLAVVHQAREDELNKQKEIIQIKEQKLEEALKSADIEVNKKVAEKMASEKLILWKKALAEAEKNKQADVKMLEEQLKDKDAQLSQANTEALKSRLEKQKFEEDKRNFELEKNKQIEAERTKIEATVAARIGQDMAKLQQQLTAVEKEKQNETKLLEDQLKEKDIRLSEAQKNELEVRKEKNRLEEEKKDFEIQKQIQMDEERKQIAEEVGKKAAEEQQYVIAQLKKQLSDATKAKDDLARKLEQGSQQSQGEVLELELEQILKDGFPLDEIIAVRKGVNGADIIQKVSDRSGRTCGQIVWELKNTKTWNDNYIQKLKDDQRNAKADLAVIVSVALPADVKGFVFREGVWICEVKLALALATALRINLENISREKNMSVGKNEKMEVLYSYLTGVEFKQRVEAIVEAFTNMDEGLRVEKRAYEKIWAEREKQIQKVISNTVGMYGDLSGLVTLPQIKTLELVPGEEVK